MYSKTLLIFSTLLSLSLLKTTTINPYIVSCPKTSYYDSTTYSCLPCGDNSIQDNNGKYINLNSNL